MTTDNMITSGLNPDIDIASTATISPYVLIGFKGDEKEKKDHHKNLPTLIGENVWIGPYVTIYEGASIQDGVKIDPYCRVGHNTCIGKHTRLLYGARIHDDVSIGNNCVIGGNCSNRVKIGNNVVHFGRITHTFNNPRADWHDAEEPSLSIGDGSIIGAEAILVGDIRIGKSVYIAAGEIVRHSVEDACIVYKGRTYSHSEWKGRLSATSFWSEYKK